jgi:hypothetical protein
LTTFTVEAAQAAVERLEDEGYEASVYPDYSGRFMYGETCVGIVTSPGASLALGAALAAVGVAAEDMPRRTDNMALDMIYY